MNKKSKVTMQKVIEKGTFMKNRAKMKQVRRVVVNLRAKISLEKAGSKARMMMRLKVKKSMTQ